jgi:glutamate-5-semialdehyde dehydrogenase
MTNTPNPLDHIGHQARRASEQLAQVSTAQKNTALAAIAIALKRAQPDLLAANAKDVHQAKKKGMADALIDRLLLDENRIVAILESIGVVQALPEPLGRVLDVVVRPNGLRIEKIAVPLGVIGIIFESRPNVAIDAAALCIRSGNACILRCGSDSLLSVQILVRIIQMGLAEAGLSQDAVQLLPSADRALVSALLKLDRYVDVIIPRGGQSLIARVRAESRVPVFSHLDGVCHIYLDAEANAAKAVGVTVNGKMRRPSICGATECLILHRDIVSTIGKNTIFSLLNAGCEVRVPHALLHFDAALRAVSEGDYGHEFLAPIIAVAVVSSVEEAVGFIRRYGSHHTDAIVTEDEAAARYFFSHVESAIVMHNASTQFADGGEFGKGVEIGIATGKLHARGPVGLEELTTYQYRVHGNGQIRP